MTKSPTGTPLQANSVEQPFEDVSTWMALQIAARLRRARTRRELFRTSERDLDRMGLTRFDVGN